MLAFEVKEKNCRNIRRALQKEWLETNGLGDYASSTTLCCNTRKYHGLLVANLTAPEGRHVLLSAMEETLLGDQREFPLSCRKHPGVFHPKGWEFLHSVQTTPWPAFSFRLGDYRLTREIMLPYQKRMVLIRYSLHGPEQDSHRTLQLKPLIAFRNFHALTRSNFALHVKVFPARQGFLVRPYNELPPLYMQVDGEHVYYPAPDWYYNVEYFVEQERGYPYQEDLFLPAVIELELAVNGSVVLSASTEEIAQSLEDLWQEEALRRKKRSRLVPKGKAGVSQILGHLAEVGEAFLIQDQTERPAILAGYHWFDAWGRDSLISLPGLTFCAGRVQEGLRILTALSASAHDGLIPNCYRLDPADNAYNSADASLWYAWAVQQLLTWTRGHNDFVRDVCLPTLLKIVDAFRSNRLPGIHIDDAQMLHVGNEMTQLTWMDAVVQGRPVTPRYGCPVEINALWYNTLRLTAQLAGKFGGSEENLQGAAKQLSISFSERFWVEQGQGGYLADVWRENMPDTSIRPNQIFAVSLPFAVLKKELQPHVVESVRANLLTPFGLATLSPGDPSFIGTYAGGPEERDRAYHQGTVWPWLLGGYFDALLRTTWDIPSAVQCFLDGVTPFFSRHLGEAGLGYISEVFDGSPPHEPNGCIAQAWSVAEVYRMLRLACQKAPAVFSAWESELVVR